MARPRKAAPVVAGNRRDERAEERPGELDPEGGRNAGEHADLNRNQYQCRIGRTVWGLRPPPSAATADRRHDDLVRRFSS